jgi:hypothetical protein
MQQCVWRVWLVSGAFHAVVQPMLAATYKVQCIHSAARALASSTSQRRLRMWRVAAVLPVVLLNATWTLIAPLQPKTIVVDVLRPAGAFTVCAYTSWVGQLLLVLSCVYGGTLLLLTCVFAYRIRQLPRTYHDAQALALSVYLFGFSAFCIFVIQSSLGEGRDRSVAELVFALRSGGTLIVYQTTAALLIGSRIPGTNPVSRRREARTRNPASLHLEASPDRVPDPAGHELSVFAVSPSSVHNGRASLNNARVATPQPAAAVAMPPVILHTPRLPWIHNHPASVVLPVSEAPLSESMNAVWSEASLELDPPATRV